MRGYVKLIAGMTAVAVLGCATAEKRDIESELIAAFREKGKTVEIKIGEGRETYTIDPTGRFSTRGCPLALIKGWKDGEKFKETEVEVCDER